MVKNERLAANNTRATIVMRVRPMMYRGANAMPSKTAGATSLRLTFVAQVPIRQRRLARQDEAGRLRTGSDRSGDAPEHSWPAFNRLRLRLRIRALACRLILTRF